MIKYLEEKDNISHVLNVELSVGESFNIVFDPVDDYDMDKINE